VHDHQCCAALTRHVRVDIECELQRRTGRQRQRVGAGRHDVRLRQNGQPIERAKCRVALWLAPEQNVAVRRQRRQQAACFLVEAEPAGGPGHDQCGQQTERNLLCLHRSVPES